MTEASSRTNLGIEPEVLVEIYRQMSRIHEVDKAIKSVGNKEGGVKDVIHASLMPWL